MGSHNHAESVTRFLVIDSKQNFDTYSSFYYGHLWKPSSKTFSLGTRSKTFLKSTTAVYSKHLNVINTEWIRSYTNNYSIPKISMQKSFNQSIVHSNPVMFLNCYLAGPHLTLGHCWGSSLTNPVLITDLDSWFNEKVSGSLLTRLGTKACLRF